MENSRGSIVLFSFPISPSFPVVDLYDHEKPHDKSCQNGFGWKSRNPRRRGEWIMNYVLGKFRSVNTSPARNPIPVIPRCRVRVRRAVPNKVIRIGTFVTTTLRDVVVWVRI